MWCEVESTRWINFALGDWWNQFCWSIVYTLLFFLIYIDVRYFVLINWNILLICVYLKQTITSARARTHNSRPTSILISISIWWVVRHNHEHQLNYSTSSRFHYRCLLSVVCCFVSQIVNLQYQFKVWNEFRWNRVHLNCHTAISCVLLRIIR